MKEEKPEEVDRNQILPELRGFSGIFREFFGNFLPHVQLLSL